MGTTSDAINLDTVVQRRHGQISADLEEEVALMSIDRGNYYLLNSVGARIWQDLERPRRIGDLCDKMLLEYEVAREQLESDVVQLLCELVRHALVELVDESAA